MSASDAFEDLGPDRMPPLADEDLTDEQKQAAGELAAGRRGGVIGPFIPALRSPEFMHRLERLGSYLRFENALGPRLTELAILLTAQRWRQSFEWSVHVVNARKHGFAPATIEAIRLGQKPDALAADEQLVYDFFRELDASQAVSDATYERAVRHLGERGVVDLIGVFGYYATLAMLLNVARTPLPDDPESLA